MKRASATALAVLTVASSAHAEEPRPPIVLTVGTCAGVDPAELRRILPIELDAPLAEAHDAGTLDVSVQCEGERAHLRIEGAHAPMERALDLSTTSEVGRTRYVAIAIAELVSTPDVPAPPVVVPAPPPTPPVVASPVLASEPRPVAAPSPAAPSWTVGALLRERVSFGPGTLTTGGGAFVRHSVTPALELTVDASGEYGSTSVSLGTVDVTMASLGVIVGAHRTRRWLTVRGGVGLRGGISNVSGAPTDSSATHHGSFVAAWGGPALETEIEVLLASTVTVGLGSEVGANVIPSHALVNGAREVELAGVWVGLRLSLGVRF